MLGFVYLGYGIVQSLETFPVFSKLSVVVDLLKEQGEEPHNNTDSSLPSHVPQRLIYM